MRLSVKSVFFNQQFYFSFRHVDNMFILVLATLSSFSQFL